MGMKSLYQHLKEYGESDFYGFHMPGHKRNVNMMGAELPYQIDITEIEGFDDLHHPAGIIGQAQDRAARVYQAEETHFLVNGSTVGILSAIMGTVNRGEKILAARNCHKSVYNAIRLKELEPVYLYPRFREDLCLNGELAAEDVKQALDAEPDIKAVVIVSPTYDGVVSDIPAIAAAAHDRQIPLIVDEAHGAHLGFHEYFPENGNGRGADIVIHSLHKTLPALTQTALLHMNGSLVKRKQIRQYLQMLQSSSPSYILMAGIDACIEMMEVKGKDVFNRYVCRLNETRKELSKLNSLKLIETECYDYSKIVISVQNTDITSKELYCRLLEEYHLQMEMAAGTYVLAMTAPGDTAEGFQRLVRALKEIDAGLSGSGNVQKPGMLPVLERVYTSAEAGRISAESDCVKRIPWEASEGYVALESAYLYPPGSPLIVPGERISKEVIGLLDRYRTLQFEIRGLTEEGKIEVLMNG